MDDASSVVVAVALRLHLERVEIPFLASINQAAIKGRAFTSLEYSSVMLCVLLGVGKSTWAKYCQVRCLGNSIRTAGPRCHHGWCTGGGGRH
jgi:hypothetical protein